jgi:glutaryl-CoA dehydrogenase
MRDFVKIEITPFIEEWAQNSIFPKEIVRKFGEMGAFGPTIPAIHGGGEMDYMSYGLIMQEIERGKSKLLSNFSR